ncbi:NAD(P)H-binding protein [Actinomadura rudentiformis]|uniref:NAD(P)H-binding protein n=1 Tax=Actinomadura rudentiformis TaxID=359158 RepID=A0A6H9YY85_9ACTN|nr:NAD(P)H-binding protein [Actinomadura rudentiformis]KAB2349102.1 NAD(P)H-binding protein [Actinomadura rudentiformis]
MFVVTGATGNVGRPLVQALAAAGEKVTAVSRRPADGDAPAGVRHLQADMADAVSLKPALDGAEAIFLMIPDNEIDLYAVLDVVKASGTRRIVLLTSQGAVTRPHSASHGPARVFEEAVRRSGLEWTILQPGGFASNAFWWAEAIREHRTVVAPFADVGLPVIDPADIAEVAAAVLRDESHSGRTYVLTGPELSSVRERTQVIADALGTRIEFVEQSRADAAAQLRQLMPEEVAEGTLDILGEPTPAEQEVSPDVEKVLGRPARTFAEWVERNIAAFK